MAQRTDPSHSDKHVCIFELERKGDAFTENVVCRVCGVYLSSLEQAQPRPSAPLRPENHISES
jgi:hypothetical protein